MEKQQFSWQHCFIAHKSKWFLNVFCFNFSRFYTHDLLALHLHNSLDIRIFLIPDSSYSLIRSLTMTLRSFPVIATFRLVDTRKINGFFQIDGHVAECWINTDNGWTVCVIDLSRNSHVQQDVIKSPWMILSVMVLRSAEESNLWSLDEK